MILLLAPALLALAPAQDASCRRDTNFEAGSAPSMRSGPGLWIGGIQFDPSDIQFAGAAQSEYTDEWVINLSFTETGHAKFGRAQRCGVRFPIEISFDRKLISSPVLLEPIRGYEVTISGGFTQESAATLAARIKPAS